MKCFPEIISSSSLLIETRVMWVISCDVEYAISVEVRTCHWFNYWSDAWYLSIYQSVTTFWKYRDIYSMLVYRYFINSNLYDLAL